MPPSLSQRDRAEEWVDVVNLTEIQGLHSRCIRGEEYIADALKKMMKKGQGDEQASASFRVQRSEEIKSFGTSFVITLMALLPTRIPLAQGTAAPASDSFPESAAYVACP